MRVERHHWVWLKDYGKREKSRDNYRRNFLRISSERISGMHLALFFSPTSMRYYVNICGSKITN